MEIWFWGQGYEKKVRGVVGCVFCLAAWVDIVSKNNPTDQLLAPFSSHSAPAGCQGGSENQQK